MLDDRSGSRDIAMRVYATNDNWRPGAPDSEPEFYHDFSSGAWKHPVKPRKGGAAVVVVFCAIFFAVGGALAAWGVL